MLSFRKEAASKRDFSIVLFGATGYTGRKCAEYLASKMSDDKRFTWAMTGRDKNKLEALQESLKKSGTGPTEVIVIESLEDHVKVQQVTSRAHVVLSAAGPFTLCGEPILRACVNSSTDYVDITAELPWVQLMAQKYQFEASQKNIKIIPCCGYDFVPNDMMMHQLHEFLHSRAPEDNTVSSPSSVVHLFEQSTPFLSGGTALSGMNMFASLPIRDAISYYRDSFAMCQYPIKPAVAKKNSEALIGCQYVPETDKYLAPFVMSSLMQKYVHWSNELQNFHWGHALVYMGGLSTSSIFKAWFLSISIWLQFFLALIVSRIPIAWKLLQKPGTGPPVSDKAFFESQLIARVPCEKKSLDHVTQDLAEERIKIIWRMESGEAYLATAIFSVEAARVLCDPVKRAQCPPCFGVTSPSASLGNVYLKQLEAETLVKMTISQMPPH